MSRRSRRRPERATRRAPAPRPLGRWGRSTVAVLASLTLLGAVPGAAGAQAEAVELHPSVATAFFPTRVLDLTARDGTELEVRLEGALAAAASVAVRPVDRLALELEVLYTRTQSSTSGAETADGFSTDVGTDYWHYGIALRWTPADPGGRLRPFVVAGIGEKEFSAAFLESDSGFTGSLGAGLRIEMPGGPDVQTELRDYVSRFDPGPLAEGVDKGTHLQHDLVWEVGAVVGLF